jgi:hypothetical protein
MEFPAQTFERQRFVEVLLDEAANRLHAVGLVIAALCPRMAAQAGSVSRLFRCLRSGKEPHIFPPRTPRPARGPAVHSRRRNAEDKLSIAHGVSREHRMPALLVSTACVFSRRIL